MNKKQKIALWVGIIIISLMGIFPPWITEGEISGAHVYALAKYSFILIPPYNYYDAKLKISMHHIDFSKLIIQWFIVGIISTGFIITFHETK